MKEEDNTGVEIHNNVFRYSNGATIQIIFPDRTKSAVLSLTAKNEHLSIVLSKKVSKSLVLFLEGDGNIMDGTKSIEPTTKSEGTIKAQKAERIMSLIAQYFGVPIFELTKRHRRKDIYQKRLCYILLRKHADLMLEEVARYFNISALSVMKDCDRVLSEDETVHLYELEKLMAEKTII